jgi:hypothetical protein
MKILNSIFAGCSIIFYLSFFHRIRFNEQSSFTIPGFYRGFIFITLFINVILLQDTFQSLKNSFFL